MPVHLNLLQAEEAQRKHSITAKTVFQNLSLKPPSEGPASVDWMTKCLGRPGQVQSSNQVLNVLWGCTFGTVWGIIFLSLFLGKAKRGICLPG